MADSDAVTDGDGAAAAEDDVADASGGETDAAALGSADPDEVAPAHAPTTRAIATIASAGRELDERDIGTTPFGIRRMGPGSRTLTS